ncbi:hypothetical protein KAR91_66995 [Candidatus Pacearchaeota archaeon]|nr:hypothetical protein [Candidatus Pacearchaeota archaeon]
MKFKQLENSYFQSEDGCKCIPNVPGNRDFDRIQAYLDDGHKLIAAKNITISDDWQKPEPIPEPENIIIEEIVPE